jgi:diaminopimelate epimerase
MAAMDRLEFAKGHGTGNDFVIIPDPDGALDLPASLVAALCDRRFGIGADGVLRVVRAAAHPEAADSGAEWFMDYRNADGSVAEMCGNGARVFARYLIEAELAPPGEITVATRTGLVTARVAGGLVTVTMAQPRLSGTGTARLAGLELAGTAVDCGNPHLVCPLPLAVGLASLDLTGSPEVDPGLFPDGVNVELTTAGEGVPDADAHLRMRVHERGVGETLSCGSGACAAAAVALRAAGREHGTVVVDVPGGLLRVILGPDRCALQGPAVIVAHGIVDAGRLVAAPTTRPG